MIDIDSIPGLRQALAAGNASPESVAKDALVRANSNASHNVYISLDAERTPLRLQLGADAVDAIRAHANTLLADLAQWERVAADTSLEDRRA